MLKTFPSVTVFSFEPAVSTNAALKRNFKDHDNVKIFQLALDKSSGVANFIDNPLSTNNRVVRDDEQPKSVISVEKIAGDAFCTQRGVQFIDFLKIDTEGNDLNVLVGFSSMLGRGDIRYLQVECTTNYDNRFHVHLEKVMQFLHPLGYRLYGLYDFERYIYRTRQPMNGIWFCNAVFVREIESPRLREEVIN